MKERTEMKFNESTLEIVTLELNTEGWKWGVRKTTIYTGRTIAFLTPLAVGPSE